MIGLIVDCLALKPYLCSYRLLTLFSKRNDIIVSCISFSSNFENEVRRLMGR